MACRECGDLLADNCYVYQMKSGKKEIEKHYHETICKPCKILHSTVRARLQKLHPHPGPGSPCDLCGRIDKLVLDHCHVLARTDWQKSFRGYLCANCNEGLGKLSDSAAGVKRAFQYLENFEKGNASSPERTGGCVEIQQQYRAPDAA